MSGCNDQTQIQPDPPIQSKYSKIWFVTEFHTGMPTQAMTFKVHYEHLSQDYLNGRFIFTYWRDGDQNVANIYINKTDQTKSGNMEFEIPVTEGKYFYLAKMDPNTGSDFMQLSTPPHLPIPLTISSTAPQRNVFKICEAHMKRSDSGFYKLWDTYKDIVIDYDGFKFLNAAFNSANTDIAIDNVPNVDYLTPEQLSNFEQLQNMCFKAAYGDMDTYQTYGYGLDPNRSIIVAIDDETWNPPSTPTTDAGGITWPTDQGNPTWSLVFCGKIERGNPTNPYYRIQECGGFAIHELGHARGILNDNTLQDPQHGSPDVDKCIMNSPPSRDALDIPLFCGGHITYLSKQTW